MNDNEDLYGDDLDDIHDWDEGKDFFNDRELEELEEFFAPDGDLYGDDDLDLEGF